MDMTMDISCWHRSAIKSIALLFFRIRGANATERRHSVLSYT